MYFDNNITGERYPSFFPIFSNANYDDLSWLCGDIPFSLDYDLMRQDSMEVSPCDHLLLSNMQSIREELSQTLGNAQKSILINPEDVLDFGGKYASQTSFSD